ncbi:MAG: SpoIIE family protein phosphatase [Actinomycetia bacterium]|nr:SpoIIE family protein phosphatase [Actinomycetes bacterium]
MTMGILSRRTVHEELSYLQDIQIIGAILGVFVHTVCLIMFAICKVDIMFWFNVFISLPVFTAGLIFSYKGFLKIGPLIVTIEVVIHQVLATLLIGQESGFQLFLFCLIPIGILFQNWKISFFANALLAFVLFLAISWFDSGQLIRYQLPENTLRIIRLINSTGIFTVMGLILFYYITLNKKLYSKQKVTSEQLSHSNQVLNDQHRKIKESIQYAERIQSAVLIPEDYLTEFMKDHFVLFKPRDIVSGDFFWAAHQDKRLVIAAADCTGHGVPGALLSMLGISFLNEIVSRSESMHANQILNLLRTYLIASLHQTGRKGEAQEGLEIALCVLDAPKNLMEFSGANRPLYIIRENGSDRDPMTENLNHELIQIDADKMPIGIYDQELTPFNNNIIHLQKNDAVYLFSDGYVDQMGGPRRKTFRSHRFKNLLLEIQDQTMEKQKFILTETMESWRGDVEQIDDILVLGFKT